MPEILIHSPFAEQSSQGNSVTALRMEEVLRGAGYGVIHTHEEYAGESADAMIALNARKSAKAIARFRYRQQSAPLVVVLTGTDINHPDVIDEKSATWISMKIADQLVVLHEASMAQVPQKFREKTVVIYPSVTLSEGVEHMPEGYFTAVMAGNMRQEKNPAMAAAVAEKVSNYLKIHHYGEADDLDSETIIRHGIVPHEEMLAAMARAHVLLNTSYQEGGANAICEAICMGLPVVASAIPGNMGMLGEGYAGLYPSDDLGALVKMLEKTVKNVEFYALLKGQIEARAPMFAFEKEARKWAELLSGLLGEGKMEACKS